MPRDRGFFEKYALYGLIGTMILFIGVFGYIFSRNFMTQKEQHQEIIHHLNALQLLNQKIDAYFSYEFQNVNYDDTVYLTGKFKTELITLHRLTSIFDDDTETRMIVSQLERVKTLAQKRNIYLEQYKSHKAVAINSMRYLPNLYIDIKNTLLKLRVSEAYRTDISGRTADMLTYIFYSLFRDAEDRSRLQENISAIESLYGRNEPLDSKLAFFILHAKNIEAQKVQIDEQIAKKNTLGLTEELDKLNSDYLKYLDADFENKKRLNIILFSVVIILLISLMILFYHEQKFKYQLEALNDTLEIRIKDETQKRINNEHILMQQSKLNAMGELITSISHQWRQPLNALGIIIQDIEDAYEFNELDRPYIDQTISKSMDHINNMSKTIDEFRSFFKQSDAKVAIDVLKSIQYAVQMLEYRIEKYKINLQLRYDETEVYTVMGLRSEFEQMMMILINNAIDAITQKLNTVENPEEGRINITVSRNERVRIEVEDNGIGIDPVIVDRIFEPYYTTKDQGEGIGMGLYIARLVLENHMNGSIRYIPGGNTTKFIIEMEII